MEGSSSTSDHRRVMPHLPEEIIANILSRFPILNLKRFECLSKAWFAMIRNDQLLWEFQLGFSSCNPKTIISPLMVKFTTACDTLVLYEKQDRRNICSLLTARYMPESFFITNTCQGLICSINSYGWGTIYLWNPVTREYARIPDDREFIQVDDRYEKSVAGLGYDSQTFTYKVVRLYESSKRYLGARIHNVGSGIWRSLGKLDDTYFNENYLFEPLLMIGNSLHWIVTRGDDRDICIISLTISTEQIDVKSVPPFFKELQHVGIANLSGCLAVYTCTGTQFLVSVMSNERNVWIKSFTIPFQPRFPTEKGRFYGSHTEGVYILDMLDHFVSYDFRNQTSEIICWSRGSSLVFPHIDSLVSPKALLEVNNP